MRSSIFIHALLFLSVSYIYQDLSSYCWAQDSYGYKISAVKMVCSVNNKSLTLDIILEKELDLVCLTETWHNQSDGLLFNELTPTGYGLFDSPRPSGTNKNKFCGYPQVSLFWMSGFECL